MEQFAELPIIMAANQFQKVNANGNFEGQFMKFVALDKETGKLRYGKAGLAQGQYYAILTDPKTGVIDVLNHSNQRIRFTPDDGKNVSSAGPTTGGFIPPSPTVPFPGIRGNINVRVIAAPAVIDAPAIAVPVPKIEAPKIDAPKIDPPKPVKK